MNQAVNFFWTILCFTPVVGFWLTADMPWCYVFTGISAVSLLIPARLLQLSSRPRFYESLGVRQIRKFVQNGDYANRLIRRVKPGYKTIKNRADSAAYLKTVKMYQGYHLLCFLFFLLTAVYAIIKGQYLFFGTIALANIIYNVCPILLQQYNRARILRYL